MDADDWDTRYTGSDLLWGAGPNRFLVEQAEALGWTPGRALDLACGEGRNAIWLAGQGWEVEGVDFSGVAVERARALAAERGVEATFTVADVVAHQPPAEAFDLVLVFYLQLPEELRRTVLSRAAAALAPGGTLLYVAHDRANLDGGHGGPRDPAVLATAEEVAGELDGLDVATARVVERPVETPGGPVTALDSLVLAVRRTAAASP